MMLFEKYRKFEELISYLLSPIIVIIIIILLSPLFLIISLLIFIFDGKPIIFRTKRIGYMGKSFTLYKFRSMHINQNSDIDRITKLGKYLRRSSLDELPQLFNILKGEMVFVGPRPLPLEVLINKKFKKYFKKRSSVKPGLTGLSQSFSRGLPRQFSKKLIYDILYIRKKSIFFDIIIIFKTIYTLKRRFVSNKLGTTL